MKSETIQVDRIGHLVQVSADDWKTIVEWLKAHDVKVKETKPRKQKAKGKRTP